jgi:amino acid adenylation domain-containing protein
VTLLDLLDDCARLGVTLAAEGDTLRVRAPKGNLTPELRQSLNEHKPSLLVHLRKEPAEVPLPRADRDAATHPLSPVQQSLWFLGRRDPDSLPAYNIRKAFLFEGALDVGRWNAALRAVVARHAALRTSFVDVDEHPLAQVSPSLDASWTVIDATEADAQRILDEEGRRRFDLARAPLFRAVIVRMPDDRALFLLNAHHLIADAWSAGILLRELVAAYEGRALPPLDTTYADYALWQRTREDLGPHLDYWREQLRDLPLLQLPVDTKPKATAGYDGASEPFVIAPEVAAQLRAFTQSTNGTPFTTLYAAFAALLARYSGQSDFPVGTSVAGRGRRELEDVIGFFADLLIVRMDLTGGPTFRQLVERVQRALLDGLQHGDVPFDALVKAVRPERAAGQNPLMQVLFLYLQSDLDGPFRDVQVPSVTSKFDLSLHVEETRDGLRGLIEYKTSLFQPATIRRLVSAWQQLLAAAVCKPDTPVSQLPLLDEATRHELLVARNQIHAADVPYPTLHAWFSAQAARTPDHVAVTEGVRSLTYAELEERSTRVAQALIARGVGPETRVGLYLERSTEIVIAVLGVLKAGGAYVPLDPADPPARLAYAREDSRFALLVDAELLRELESGGPALRLPEVHPLNAAYVIYTSGSTGQPRGVVVTHANVTRLMASTERWYQFNDRDVWTLFHSYAFDFSVWEIWGALLYGGRLVIVPHLVSRSPEQFHRLLADEGVTVLNQTPSAFYQLMRVDDGSLALRYVIFGGEALDPARLAPWFARYGDTKPQLVNMYGITETTVHVTHRPLTAGDGGSVIGARIPDLTLTILDEQLQPVPEGVAGELHVGGAGLSRGYLGRPARTAERFIPDPHSPEAGARLYRTGDLARWRADGDIEYLGRRDDQVKIRGFRIELGEIESVVRAHEGVRECVVLVREDAPGQKRLVAYFIGDADPVALRALCESRLPSHMVPAAFVTVAEWPRTRNDKLDRAKLPAPELAAPAESFVAPRNDAERAIADVWSRVLNVPRVGVNDDFFALGGDSIISLEVLSQMRKAGYPATVAQLYAAPRIADLAAAPSAVHATPIPQPTSPKRYPLSQLQAGMLYEEQLAPEQALYHDIFSFHFRLALDEARFRTVLQGMIDQHPALRTSFDLTSHDEPLQIVHDDVRAVCRFEDLSALRDDEQEARIALIVNEERRHRFDYARPPLLRFYVIRRAADRTQIVFGFHHAILDGWSVATMMSGLLAAYTGADTRDDAPAVHYSDFIALEREALASDDERAYWQKELAQLPATRLPRAGRGGARSLAPLSMPLPDDVSDGLQKLARMAGTPLKSVVLAAHLRVLAALAGAPEGVTGLVTNGRPEGAGGERVLGLFLNTLPLHVAVGEGSFVDLVQRTFDAERRLLEHRRFPMPALKRMAGGRTLFDAAFNFIHFHVYAEVMKTPGLELLGHRVWEETDFPFLAQFSVFPGTSRVALDLVYDRSEFSDEQMQRVAGYYLRCLAAMAEAPQASLRAASLLPEGERALLESWGGLRGDFTRRETLHGWFETQAARFADRVAVRCEDEELTYAQLDARANQLAHHLRALGVGPETLVGLCLDRSAELVVSIVAILKAGGAYVPLDPSYPASRLDFIINDSNAALVVTRSPHAALLGDVPKVLLDADADLIGARPATPLADAGDPAQAAYVIYTSGSTGKPKGVVVTHANVTRLMASTESLYGFNEHDVWTLFHSYAFDFSVWELWGALLYGGRVVVVPYAVSRAPEQFAALLARERVTVLNQTPSAFYQLMAIDPEEQLSLRYVIFGGEALDIPRLKPWFEKHGDTVPRLVNMYGITETTVHVTHRPLSMADTARPSSVIGRPLPDLAALVLDEGGEPVPLGVSGELYVGGAGVARGYLRRDELTAARFVTREGRHLYRTGDLVRWLAAADGVSGELEYLGRIDAQVKVRGFRIELGEIEHVLLAQAGVREAAVVARDGQRLIAYAVGDGITPHELRRACEAQLPDYMVPSAYVLLDALPLTANGKLDRPALSVLPDPGAEAVPHRPFVAPRNDVETQLCGLWEGVLGVAPVGIRQSFFELGGHSLHATQLMARVRERFAVDLPLRSLFDEPTVEKLAQVIDAQRAAKTAVRTAPIKSRRRAVRLSEQGEVVEGP